MYVYFFHIEHPLKYEIILHITLVMHSIIINNKTFQAILLDLSTNPQLATKSTHTHSIVSIEH